jgi:A/G-specific adenine glycosylase
MLVIVSHGDVLLQKRPSAGIWGGLWSLPEVAEGDEPVGALRRTFGLTVASSEALAPFEHAFTHFRLEVKPWLLRARRPATLAAEHGATWLPLSELTGAALPAPVKKLLRSVAASSGTGAAPRAAATRR